MAKEDCTISVEKLLNIVHYHTERIKIYVVGVPPYFRYNGCTGEFYLTTDLSGSKEETERILKYYRNVPVWNLHVDISDVCNYPRPGHGRFVVGAIVANCYFADIQEGLAQEKEDKRKAKARERYARKKQQ